MTGRHSSCCLKFLSGMQWTLSMKAFSLVTTWKYYINYKPNKSELCEVSTNACNGEFTFHLNLQLTKITANCTYLDAFNTQFLKCLLHIYLVFLYQHSLLIQHYYIHCQPFGSEVQRPWIRNRWLTWLNYFPSCEMFTVETMDVSQYYIINSAAQEVYSGL